MMPIESQIQTLMRAWPLADRIERGDEIAGTTLDLVPDGATRLPLLLAISLVVGGVRARWRMRPPVWRWLYYRMGGRLSSRWHRWMINDLYSPGWRRRMIVSRLIIAMIAWLVGTGGAQLYSHQYVGSIPLAVGLLVFFFGTTVIQVVQSREERDRQSSRNGYRQTSDAYPPWPPPSPGVSNHRPIPE